MPMHRAENKRLPKSLSLRAKYGTRFGYPESKELSKWIFNQPVCYSRSRLDLKGPVKLLFFVACTTMRNCKRKLLMTVPGSLSITGTVDNSALFTGRTMPFTMPFRRSDARLYTGGDIHRHRADSSTQLHRTTAHLQ